MDPAPNAEAPESDAHSPEKRPAEGEGLEERPVKRAKAGQEEMRRVAEIVLVLSAMAGMRGGGRSPTEAEVELMAEARAKLAEICEGLSPKDLVARDSVWTVIEDLGLNWKAKDQRLGFRASRLSIKEKFSLAKRKMDDAKKFSASAATYTPGLGPMHTIRTISSDKTSNVAMPSGGAAGSSVLQGHNPVTTTPAAVTYQPHATGLPSGHLGRDSSAVAKTQPKFDGGTNGTTYAPQMQANHHLVNTPTWSLQPHSTSSGKVAPENKMANHNAVKIDGTSDLGGLPRSSSQVTRDHAFRPVVFQSPSTSLPSTHPMMQNSTGLPSIPPQVQNSTSFPSIHPPMQNVKLVHSSSAPNNHGEIAKLVQKLLQPKLPERPNWTPPSRDYMSKATVCQMCRVIVHEIDTVVLCDSCEKGYHLKCLEALNQKGIPRGEWHCSKCTSLSAGKPLPPKYGRVMRSMTTPPKGTPNASGAQSSSDKKTGTADPKVNQEKPMTNKSSSLQSTAGSDALGGKNLDSGLDRKIPKEKDTAESISSDGKGVEQGTLSGTLSINSAERSTQQTQVSESCKQDESSASKPQPPAVISDKIGQDDDLKSLHIQQDMVHPKASNYDEVSSNTCQAQSIVKESEIKGENTDCESRHDSERSEQDVVHANSVGKPNASNDSGGQNGLASNGLRNVEWIGNVLTVVDGKRYYEACCVHGATYKLQDHALFHSSNAKLIPSKLQAMWEDIKSGSKWVLVNRCYFPDDLPKAVGHPCAPESNEVYESNHGISVLAGLIQGQCEVLHHTKFKERSEKQSQSGIEANNGSSPVFLCKWFFDESKGNFQPVFS